MCVSRSAPRRPSHRRMPSSGCRRPASAAPTCGRTAASVQSRGRLRWATSIAASSKKLARAVISIRPGQFVIGSFFASDNTCALSRWLPDVVPAQRTRRGGAGAGVTRPTGGRHAGGDARRENAHAWKSRWRSAMVCRRFRLPLQIQRLNCGPVTAVDRRKPSIDLAESTGSRHSYVTVHPRA
jgi:hypothetical protein